MSANLVLSTLAILAFIVGMTDENIPDCAQKARVSEDHYGIAFLGIQANYGSNDLTFNVWRSDTQEISNVLPENVEIRRLGTQASFSPDGRHFAFHHRDPAGSVPQVFVANALTGDISKITNIDRLGFGVRIFDNSWSPTGSEIVIFTMEGYLLIRCDGENPRPIPGTFRQWSQDGSLIVAELQDADETLVLIDSVSLEVIKFLIPSLDVGTYALSPDNSTLAFTENRDGEIVVNMLNIETGDVKQVLDVGRVVVRGWSPNGESLLHQEVIDTSSNPIRYILTVQKPDGSLHSTSGVNIRHSRWLPDESGLIGLSFEELEILPPDDIVAPLNYQQVYRLQFIPLDCFASQRECGMDDFLQVEDVFLANSYYDIIPVPK